MPLTLEEFVGRYGGIYEHSPWIAERAWATASGIEDAGRLAETLAHCVNQADDERKLALIRAHPDLAGKAAIAGSLTQESSEEQAAAGIDQCTPDEYRQFQSMNTRYQQKFGFPFVMAVRNSNKIEILSAFAERLKNDNDTEFRTAIGEIHKIAGLRLAAMDKATNKT